jgi:agmatine deiminase
MPAEWEPHEATWLAWPHKEESWPGVFERIPAVWTSMVQALRGSEEVRLLVRDEDEEIRIREALGGDLAGVKLFGVPTNDAWIRDYGPIFVRGPSGEGAAVTSWGFNSWGEKYGPWDLDDAVPARIGAHLELPVVETGMTLEGGSIDVDGHGTLLTTESCLLNPNRNPALGRDDIERRLKEHLGLRKILWLGEGIAGDDTDGHIDDLTRFVAPGIVVTAVEKDDSDENFRPLRENRDRLQAMTDASGSRLEVIDLPTPSAVYHEGCRCPASYANFFIANEVVLVPTFRCAADGTALGVLGEVFQGRQVVGIDCYDLIWGLGAVHCVTQQHPSP